MAEKQAVAVLAGDHRDPQAVQIPHHFRKRRQTQQHRIGRVLLPQLQQRAGGDRVKFGVGPQVGPDRAGEGTPGKRPFKSPLFVKGKQARIGRNGHNETRPGSAQRIGRVVHQAGHKPLAPGFRRSAEGVEVGPLPAAQGNRHRAEHGFHSAVLPLGYINIFPSGKPGGHHLGELRLVAERGLHQAAQRRQIAGLGNSEHKLSLPCWYTHSPRSVPRRGARCPVPPLFRFRRYAWPAIWVPAAPDCRTIWPCAAPPPPRHPPG